MKTKNENTEIKEIKGTPFHIVQHNFENEGEKHFVVLGMSRVSPLFDTEKEAETYATMVNNWDLLIPVIATVSERVFTDLTTKK